MASEDEFIILNYQRHKVARVRVNSVMTSVLKPHKTSDTGEEIIII